MDIADLLGKLFEDEGAAITTGLISQAIGTAARAHGSRRVTKEQDRLMAEEMARQNTYQRRNDETINALLPQFTAPATEAARQDLAAKYRSYVNSTLPGDKSGDYVIPSGAPQVVKDNMTRELEKGRAAGKQTADAMADLSSYGGVDVRNAARTTDAGREIGMTNAASARSSNILPLEMQAAYRKATPYNLTSDIANGLGSLAIMGAATRRPKKNFLPGGVGQVPY